HDDCNARPVALHSFPTRRSSDLHELDHQADGAGDRGGDVADHEAEELRDGAQRVHDASGPPALARGEAEHGAELLELLPDEAHRDRKSTRLNSSHVKISYAVFCL